MDSKIIFFDIDGTILSHRNFQISDSTISAIKQAQANGHLTFINTGRTFSEIDKQIKEIGFNGFVCGCGTYIQSDSSLLFHTTIDSHTRRILLDDLRELQIGAVLEGTKGIYFDDELIDEKLQFVTDMYLSHSFHVSTWDDPNLEFDKFCIWTQDQEKVHTFYEKYKDQFDFIFREGMFIELVPKGYSKATGIQYLLNHLNIPHENAFALGDSANDLAMLHYVKNSIGMGNSEEEIKDIVSYITKDVDEGGVAHALKHFHII